MSKKLFEVEAVPEGEWMHVPGSMSWRYVLEGDVMTLTNGKQSVFVKGAVHPGDIVYGDFHGEGSTVELAKVPRQPIRKLAWKFGLTGARLEVAPKFETYEYGSVDPYFADTVISSASFDVDCWANGGHQHRYYEGGYDATYVDVKRAVIERGGEFIAAAFGRLYASNGGIRKWAISSARALELFTEEEVVKLFESVGLYPRI